MISGRFGVQVINFEGKNHVLVETMKIGKKGKEG